jgi:CBS domain-containing protein
VRDIEARYTVSLPENATIKAAIDSLVEQGLQRAAIMDKDGALVGLVSDEILVRAIGGGTLRRVPFGSVRRTKLYASPISSVMKRDIKSVGEDVPIDEAIRLMTEFGFKRVPVVDSDGKYRGMIRRDSILSALAHTF